MAILDRLLGNRMLTPESILFIDEPEAALHPAAIIKFLDMLALLAVQGVQILMATHSYFVLKKLQILTVQNDMSYIQHPFVCLKGNFFISPHFFCFLVQPASCFTP
nr:AAA family ATPase [Desulfonatronospira sp.]